MTQSNASKAEILENDAKEFCSKAVPRKRCVYVCAGSSVPKELYVRVAVVTGGGVVPKRICLRILVVNFQLLPMLLMAWCCTENSQS